MALFIDTETSGLPDARNLRWGEYPNYKHVDKYANARIVQFSMLITDTKFNYLDVKDYIIKREGFEITNGEFHGITNDISDNVGVNFDNIIFDMLPENLKNYYTENDYIIVKKNDFPDDLNTNPEYNDVHYSQRDGYPTAKIFVLKKE
jgi:hypothetical protein